LHRDWWLDTNLMVNKCFETKNNSSSLDFPLPMYRCSHTDPMSIRRYNWSTNSASDAIKENMSCSEILYGLYVTFWFFVRSKRNYSAQFFIVKSVLYTTVWFLQLYQVRPSDAPSRVAMWYGNSNTVWQD
jgi:hypothetical protein